MAGGTSDPHRKNVLVMGAGFFGVFMAFNTAQSLQSTLNTIPNLGNACLATLYATFTVVCLAGPLVVDKWGPRISMIAGALAYVLMVLSNLKPSWGLSIPAYFLVGLGAPLLWTGQAVYLSRCANYSAGRELQAQTDAGETPVLMELVKSKMEEYNGYFFSFFQANGALGLLMASCIQLETDNVQFLFIILSAICACGVAIISFGIPNVDNVSLEELAEASTESTSRRLFRDADLDGTGKLTRAEWVAKFGSEEGFDAADANKDGYIQEQEFVKANDEVGFCAQLLGTLRFGLTQPKLYLYIPIMLYNGMSLTFMFSDYGRYLVAEALGHKKVGFVMSFFYACNLVATILAGKALIRRSLLITLASICHIIFFVGVLLLRPWMLDSGGSVFANSSGNNEYSRYALDNGKNGGDWQHYGNDAPSSVWVLTFLFALIFALGDAVWESQIPAVLGGYFPTGKENSLQAANYKMWQSLGFALMFGIDTFFPDVASGEDHKTNEPKPYHNINDLFFVKVLLLLGGLVVSIVCIWYAHTSMPGGNLNTEENDVAPETEKLHSVVDQK